ncbi:MAG: lycopene beta-cyclase CrtY [Litorimonas sp.]
MSNTSQTPDDFMADMIVVGAGLSGLTAAWRCLDENPKLRVMVIEASGAVAGDHTWSFNLSDIAEHLQSWVSPFIAYQWDSYDVKFPKRERRLNIPYCTGNSEALRKCIAPHIESGRLKIRLNVKAMKLSAKQITLDTGETLSAQCIFDARGFAPHEAVFLGYQKFVGHVIKASKPHGVVKPIIMDATVPQLGGYRFVYCLPYTETEILVEDTYYTDGPELERGEVDARIKDYIINNLGIVDYEILRREQGVLPITLAVDADKRYPAREDSLDEPIKIGIGGGYYHAVTGYSFPEAIKSANLIAELIKAAGPQFHKAVDDEMFVHERDQYDEENFLRLLNRMLFRAAKPQDRYKVLQRFYGLDEGLIARFYRNRMTKKDKLRMLIGKPPVAVTKALYNFSEKAFIEREYKLQATRRET